MLDTFVEAGFTSEDCEFLYIDNSNGNKHDAYAGYNIFLNKAKGEYIILCHQDIELIYDKRQKLESELAKLNTQDKKWAIAGNAGAINFKRIYINIVHEKESPEKTKHPLPARVLTLDENFLVLRSDANLGFSSDLSGYHLYATDLTLNAKYRGMNAYVIDFMLWHKSRGTPDKRFMAELEQFKKKHAVAMSRKTLRTTITKFYLSSSNGKNFFYNTIVGRLLIKAKMFYLKIKVGSKHYEY